MRRKSIRNNESVVIKQTIYTMKGSYHCREDINNKLKAKLRDELVKKFDRCIEFLISFKIKSKFLLRENLRKVLNNIFFHHSKVKSANPLIKK